ncbi:MAG TPA: cupin domain-containing protein [Solirubrobacteraceae bacterium]
MSEQVYDPNRRQRYEFRREGENLIVEVEVAPGGDVPPHFHPAQEERWTVREGQVRFKVGKRKVVPEPGVELVVPPRTKHSFKNVGDREARIHVEVRPALELQAFLEDAAALSRAGVYTRRGVVKTPRGALRMAEFVDRYRDTTVVTWPPPALQRVLFAPLLRFSRRR